MTFYRWDVDLFITQLWQESQKERKNWRSLDRHLSSQYISIKYNLENPCGVQAWLLKNIYDELEGKYFALVV